MENTIIEYNEMKFQKNNGKGIKIEAKDVAFDFLK